MTFLSRPILHFALFLVIAAFQIHGAIAPASAQEQTITASMPQSWPPHYIARPGQPPTGFAVEIFDAVAARAGYSVEYLVMPTMREAYDAAANGKVDAMPNVGIIEARRKTFKFTEPVETFKVMIFARSDTQDINNAADLDGRRVAVIKRNIGIRLTKQRPKVTMAVFDDIRTALFDLLAGRVDALIYPEPVLRNYARGVGVEDRIKTVGQPLREIKRGIAVHPSRTEIHRRLSAAAAKFISTPEYQAIYLKWFGAPKSIWSVERVLALMGGLLVLVIVGLVGWHYMTVMRLNRALEERIEHRTSELKEAQAELLRKQRLATLGELTGTMAHELRNPLGTIVTSFEIIRHKVNSAEANIGATLDRAQRSIDRCTDIITELLDFARSSGINPEPTPIDSWVSETVDEYTFPYAVKVESDLGMGDASVDIDREQIRRVIINLLDNACHAMLEDDGNGTAERDRTMTIQTRNGGDGVEILFRDTGAGIAPENMEQVFEPLFSTKSFGVGLGLPTAQKIVTDHGGTLRLQSEPGRGTEAILWLPLAGNSARHAA